MQDAVSHDFLHNESTPANFIKASTRSAHTGFLEVDIC
jgi:hypothetical protein